MSWLIWMLSTALAQDSVKLELVHTVYAPKQPALILHPHISANNLDVTLTCGTIKVSHAGPARQGHSIRIDIPVGHGQHTCTGSLEGSFSDGTQGEMPLQFNVAVQKPLDLRATKEDIDLEKRTIAFHLGQPVELLELSVYGESGALLGTYKSEKIASTPVRMQWEPTPEAVIRLQAKATVSSGLSITMDLFPWAYTIPHNDDVVFPTGSAVIPQGETHKLTRVMQSIRDVMGRFNQEKMGFEIPLGLYLAGFTDTVGNRIKNQQLSEQRAKSLALWFKQNGFRGGIHYQGLGENGLAIQTADEVDEAANRRALYIIASEAPKESPLLPASSWRTLR